MMSRGLLWPVLLVPLVAAGCSSSSAASPAASFDRQHVARFLPKGPDAACVFDVKSGQSGKGTYVMRVKRRRENHMELEVAGRVSRWQVDDSSISGGDGGFLLVAPLERNARWQGAEGHEVELLDTNLEAKTPMGKLRGCVRTRESRRRGQDMETVTTTYCPNVGPAVIEVERKTSDGEMVTESAQLRYCRDVFTIRSDRPAGEQAAR